jgi:HNH endonuclease
MAVSKRLRFEVLRRDNHACRYCGATAPDAKLTIDHVVPVALGGQDAPANLVAACTGCNSGKGSVPVGDPIVENVAQDALRWAQALKQAADLMVADTHERNNANGSFHCQWGESCLGWNGQEWPRPTDWCETLDSFRAHGLPDVEIGSALWTMVGKQGLRPSDRWRYFCGICWRKITRIQEAAVALIAADSCGD